MQEFSSRNFYFSPGSFMGDCYRYKTKTRPKARHCLSTGGDGDRLLGVSSHVRKCHNLLIYKGLIATGHLMLYHPI